MAQQYFYDKQIRRYIQQFIRLFSGFNVQMGINDDKLPIYQLTPVRYGDVNRMAAHITRENSENIINTVPFISCYVTELNLAADRRTYQEYEEKVQVYEKKVDDTTGKYLNEVGNRYTIERHAPVPYNLIMNCDIWTSNTDQKLQLLEQIMVLFNPTLNIRTSNNPFDWSALSYVEMTNSIWSSRSVGSSVDDIVDVSTLTFSMPIFINPPAKVKQQKLIYNIINELYSLDDEDLDAFVAKENFDKTTLQYTVITLDNRKLKYENGKAYLYNEQGTQLDASGNILEWATELKPFGDLREGISQLRLRKSNNPGDSDNDIIGRLEFDTVDKNALVVTVDAGTLPANSLSAIDAVINPQANYPGDGTVTAAAIGQRYLLTNDLPISTNWTNAVAGVDDIIEYNGTAWVVSFDSSTVSDQKYVTNISSTDQLEWNGTDWFNSHEGMYKAGFWRIYI
jgi:hypothetical protein